MNYKKMAESNEIFRMGTETELTEKILEDFIRKNMLMTQNRYNYLERAYKNDYDIFHQPEKPSYKPDNRIAVNFAKYIADTFNGFFIGIPVKIDCEDEATKKYIEFLCSYNGQNNNDSELSKIVSIFGRGYEMYYVDENKQIGITYLKPTQAFMIYDDSILERERFFVRYYQDAENITRGSVSNENTVRYFSFESGSLKFVEKKYNHGFDGVPAKEYIENDERIGVYECVMSQIDAYNKALSEKANDVDYFADAYLKIIGPEVDESDTKHMRSNRIINFPGESDMNIEVDFLAKPSADSSQENLLKRLYNDIFTNSMVANVLDDKFATSSGIAIKYKMTAMSNLAQTKENKFVAGFNKRFKLIFSNPLSGMKKDAWMKLRFTFTRNYPANINDEAQTAANLSGIVSKETQLSVLSIVKSVEDELEKIQQEEDELLYNTSYPTNRTDLTENGDVLE